jgi:hypothetical protein
VPDLKSHSLPSIGQLCDAGWLIEFAAADATVRHNNIVVLQGHHMSDTRLWHVEIPDIPSADCGSKQAGCTFNKCLVAKLVCMGFKQSQVDACVFCKGKTMCVLCCTDDSILAGLNLNKIENYMQEMKRVKLDITVEGDLSDFLGMNIDRLPDGSHHLSQPKLIDSILDALRLSGDNVVAKATPMLSSRLLSRHPKSALHEDGSFHHRRAVGKLNFLKKSTHSDIASAVHQCACFYADPMVEHESAARWIAR